MADVNVTTQDIINTQMSAKIEILAQEMKDFKDEMKDFKNEMRQQNEMRAGEISAIRSSIDSMNKHVRNLTITAFVGIGAMVITSVIGIAAMVWSSIPK